MPGLLYSHMRYCNFIDVVLYGDILIHSISPYQYVLQIAAVQLPQPLNHAVTLVHMYLVEQCMTCVVT